MEGKCIHAFGFEGRTRKKKKHGRPRRRWNNNIKWFLKTGWEAWTHYSAVNVGFSSAGCGRADRGTTTTDSKTQTNDTDMMFLEDFHSFNWLSCFSVSVAAKVLFE